MSGVMTFAGVEPRKKRGTPFGRYILGEKISAGPRSAVFRATLTREDGSSSAVVIKHCAVGADIGEFRIEAAVHKKLRHPNIVQFVDTGSIDAQEFIATELIEGRDLGRVLREHKKRLQSMPAPAVAAFAIHIACELAAALEYLHNRRWIHRSLTQSAVLLGFDGSVKLCDFSRTTLSEPCSPRDDINGLSTLLREILPENIEPELDGLVRRMSATEQPDSFQSCGVLRRELQQYAGDQKLSLVPSAVGEILSELFSANPNEVPQIFVLNAPSDRQFCQALEKHLASLLLAKALRFSSPGAIVPGAERQSELERALDSAAVIVPLISAELLNDADQMRLLDRAMGLHTAKRTHLIPIRIRHVDLGELPIGALRSLPANAAPVASWADHDLAWTEIVRELRVVLGRERASLAPELPKVGDEAHRKLVDAIDHLRQQISAATREKRPTRTLIAEQTKLKKKAIALRTGHGLKSDDLLGLRFLLQTPLGRGGFGTVWSAYDLDDHKTVAVKVLSSELAHDQRAIERFRRGAKVIGELDHPHVIKLVADVAQDGDYHYFVMEHAAGGDLQGMIGREPQPPSSARLELIRQAAEALAFAHRHERRFIHRDVKPNNILLHADGTARLSDFDLVRAEVSWAGTPTHAGLGTFPFAAPEARDDAAEADARADIYSLGMTAALVLHGQKINGDDLYEHRQTIIDGLECAPAIRAALSKAISVRADDRFGSMDEFLEVLASPKP